MTYESRLAQLDGEYDTAVVETVGEVLPDGKHTATIVNARVEEAAWEELQLYLEFANEDGSVRKWHQLETKERLPWVKADLARLGYTGKLSDLETEAPRFVGLVCEITVKTKVGTERTFTNVYINKIVGRDETVKPPPPPATTPDATQSDDVPF